MRMEDLLLVRTVANRIPVIHSAIGGLPALPGAVSAADSSRKKPREVKGKACLTLLRASGLGEFSARRLYF